MFPPVDFSWLFLGYLGLVFGTSLFLLLAGGWRRLIHLLQPTAFDSVRSLAFGTWPMVAALSLWPPPPGSLRPFFPVPLWPRVFS